MSAEQRSNVLQLKYNEYKQTLEELQTKIIELGNDKEEHEVVLTTLNGVDKARKCYRMVGGALVETDVQTTIPILQTKKENLSSTISALKGELVKVAEEFEKWKKDNKIQVLKQ
ncbi:ADL004Wp [Eremothecium gossypii ATCC 10895]|uniref:ADL004Wp n=1 Tax=Eremothecium gossypii (strain ATCC 10895 / CBS 109.51 / FGSC 9923 / NRRL Y-1056) TaxID=284811 RepID=Q75AC1_EREGS|nr:ADL004Wp [Eremothecium gossypii ATCC 10895]AAS51917.2 ADL004Wp [Eremothecium gossypii ATCC 10895]AEY96216.1 FADL004Wp [Eremothecium gossypii FDAG1]